MNLKFHLLVDCYVMCVVDRDQIKYPRYNGYTYLYIHIHLFHTY